MDPIAKNPLETKEIVQLRDDANTLLYKAEEIAVINNLDEEARAVEFLTQTKRRAKIVDEKRKEYVAPLKAVIDKVNDDFKTILEPLAQAEVIVKRGMTTFRDSEELRKKQEAREEAERAAKAAVNTFKNEMTDESMGKAQEAIGALQEAKAEAPRTVEGASGGQARFRKDWKFEIVDASIVPAEYRVVDAALVRAAVKKGEREIPGVRIYEESTPIIMS